MSQDSLAAEIEGTMRKELSLDDPECEEQKYVWAIALIREMDNWRGPLK